MLDAKVLSMDSDELAAECTRLKPMAARLLLADSSYQEEDLHSRFTKVGRPRPNRVRKAQGVEKFWY